MLKLLRFVILLLTCSMLIDRSEVSCEKLRCSLYSGWMPGYLDACKIDSENHNGIFKGTRVTIDGIEDANIGGKSYDEIKALFISGISSVNYFPANINNYFKNIEGIQVTHSKLQEIRQSDLKPYIKLKYLYLSNNKITTIEKNLFEFNPNLVVVDLRSNQISTIDPNVFDKLNKLNNLQLSSNNCETEFTDVKTRSKVLDVIKRIQKGECTRADVLQKEIEIQCQQNISSLKAANDELSTKVSELKNNYSSVKGDNEICLKNLNECQSKAEHMETQNQQNIQKITSLQAANDELINKNRLLLQNANDLKEKVINLMEKNGELQNNCNSNDKIMAKLDEVSTQIESIKNVKGKNAAQNQATDDEQKTDGECLTLYYGPQQRPIILSN